MSNLGPVTEMQLQDPIFSEILWKLTPASMAVRLTQGKYQTWNYIQLLSRKLVDVAMGRCTRLIVCLPPRHGKEISNKVLINFADGSRKTLGEVRVGDYVITHGSRGRKVLEIFEHPNKPCVKVTTKTGRQIVAGLTHPMFTSLGAKTAEELRVGMGLAILRNFEANRRSERSLQEFRLAGYILGDGCVTQPMTCVIAAIDDVEKADIVSCLSTIGSTYRIDNVAVYFHKEGNLWVNETELRGKGAYEKRVPSWIFQASNVQIAHFLGAYLATDGAVSDPKTVRKSSAYGRKGERVGCTVEYCSVSKELLQDVQHLLSRLDIVSRLRTKLGKYKGNDHHSWRLIITDRRSLLNFFEQVRVHHSVKGPRLEQWAAILTTYPRVNPQLSIEEIAEIRTSSLSYSKMSTRYNVSDKILWNIRHDIGTNLPHSEIYFYDEIESIENVVEDCRCLTVDEDHTFVANDFVVHNSEIVSKWFPVWLLENFPDRKIILCSYEADFAAKWGGKARDIIAENQDTLSVRFKVKNPAMHSWETTEDGAMQCAGVGGPITGKGANVLIIDDFVKNSAEANSLIMRNNTWDWWTSTARTRIEPFMHPKTKAKVDPAVIVMATRWHSDDLIGRLINPAFSNEKGTRENWEVFVLPACAEPEAEEHYRQFPVKVNNMNMAAMLTSTQSAKQLAANASDPEWRDILGRKRGEALCPDRYSESDLALFRGGSLKDWYALYQQRPGDEADDGNVYHQFDETIHCKPLVRDEHMQLFVSMDFNVDPMTCVIGQYSKGSGLRVMERCEILEEIVMPNSNTPSMMTRLLMELNKYKYGYTLSVEVYGDAAGVQRSSQSQKTNWQIVAEYFQLDRQIHTQFLRRKQNPAIVDRINAINTMFKSADGLVRLYVDELRCPELIKDFKKVSWQQNNDGNSTGLLDKRDKNRTHISDAAGYAIEYNFALKVRAGGRRGLMQ